jgi:phosphoglycerol transferase MdoB-like AlkP superfamily enzyme
MSDFFNGNGYQVIDRTALKQEDIHYANIWGVADEDLFNLALRQLDSNDHAGKPFFSHIMTVSNHRPYTYPENRIDIPPSRQSRDGAVKYTDYAIGQFLKEASSKPWFRETVFIIVADHCASSSGKVQLPINGYHIPMMIYAPKYLEPAVIDRLTAQIDIAPTILGLLHLDYTSEFYGHDLFAVPSGDDRAFISTYQGLGYLTDSLLIIQSPPHHVEAYIPDFTTGESRKTNTDEQIKRKAQALYESSSWLMQHHQNNPAR